MVHFCNNHEHERTHTHILVSVHTTLYISSYRTIPLTEPLKKHTPHTVNLTGNKTRDAPPHTYTPTLSHPFSPIIHTRGGSVLTLTHTYTDILTY